MPNKHTCFLLLDAFRWDYIDVENTPTLYALSQRGHYAKKLKSSPGFTQRSSIFTGTWPDTTGNFTMFTYAPEHSKYKYLNYLPSFLLEYIDTHTLCDKLTRKILSNWNRIFSLKTTFPPAFIPYPVLPNIGISEDLIPIYEQKAFSPIESIFDKIHSANIPFNFIMHPLSDGRDEHVFKELMALSSESRFSLAQFSDSDGEIHKCGVGSPKALDVPTRN